MENNELQKLWKNMDTHKDHVSKNELNRVLQNKFNTAIRNFLYIIGLSVGISAAVIVFLTITALNRADDVLYLVNNITLGLLTLASLIMGLKAWFNLQNKQAGQPVKEWLDDQITELSKGLSGKLSKLYLVTIPVFFILLLLSIHVYYEYIPFTEILKNEESIVGMIIAVSTGLFVSFKVHKAIRTYQKKQLEYLHDIRKKLI